MGITKGSYALLELDNHPRADEVCVRAVALVVAGHKRDSGTGTWLTRSQIQDALLVLTGGRSVPRVFVNGQFIGGGDDTAAKARDGSLVKLLTACGAL